MRGAMAVGGRRRMGPPPPSLLLTLARRLNASRARSISLRASSLVILDRIDALEGGVLGVRWGAHGGATAGLTRRKTWRMRVCAPCAPPRCTNPPVTGRGAPDSGARYVPKYAPVHPGGGRRNRAEGAAIEVGGSVVCVCGGYVRWRAHLRGRKHVPTARRCASTQKRGHFHAATLLRMYRPAPTPGNTRAGAACCFEALHKQRCKSRKFE